MFAVLRTRGVPYLLTTSVIGRLASAMAALALVRLVVGQGGEYGYASIVGATYVIAGMVGQPLLSRLIDRSGRRRGVLIGSTLLATAGYVGTAWAAVQIPAVGLVAVAAAGFFTPPIEPALRALWPTLVEERRLTSAFALDAAAQEVGFIVGPLATVAGIALAGVQGNVLLMGAIGLAGGLAFAAHARLARMAPAVGAPAATTPTTGRHGSPLTSAAFRRIVLTMAAAAVPVGALTIVATEYAALAGSPDLSSWAIAVNAGGALTGALVFGRFPPRASAAALIRPLALGLAVLYLPLAAWMLPAAAWLALAFASGLLLPPLLTQVFTQTPLTVSERHRTEANAWVVSAFAVGVAAGTLASGFLVQLLPAGLGVSAAVAVGAVVGALGGAQAGRRALTPPAASEGPHPDPSLSESAGRAD
ncbi:MFS transporter [Humibacter sp. BT305]|nr:MFS transporter [Humibacter sp. BT305]